MRGLSSSTRTPMLMTWMPWTRKGMILLPRTWGARPLRWSMVGMLGP